MLDPFASFTAQDLRMLVDRHPLAWVCSGGEASQLPLIAEYDAEGQLVALIGHLARSNPLHEQLRTTRDALLLFSGPAAYISPEHAGKRDWAPTWNYASLRIRSRVTIDEALTDFALDVLTSAMEEGRETPWTRGAIADRYERMAKSIIGFRADIVSIAGRFKFGQDESDEVYRNILNRLPQSDVKNWMRHFNPQR